MSLHVAGSHWCLRAHYLNWQKTSVSSRCAEPVARYPSRRHCLRVDLPASNSRMVCGASCLDHHRYWSDECHSIFQTEIPNESSTFAGPGSWTCNPPNNRLKLT